LEQACRISADDISEWVTSQYERGPYPVVVVGAGRGALHLAAALGAPYLPQTVLTAVRDLETHADDPTGAMEALRPDHAAGRTQQPEQRLHVHDPTRTGRCWRAWLPAAQTPPTRPDLRKVPRRTARSGRNHPAGREDPHLALSHRGERAYFQFGALRGVPEEEYHDIG
jgi:hypothetical protein